MELILASGSPRRSEILNMLTLRYRVQTSQVDEGELLRQMPQATPKELVQRLSSAKSQAVANQLETGLVLGADTIVVLEEHIYGKPVDEQDLRNMMWAFSGKTHQVLTGVTLTQAVGRHSVSLTAVTDVTFRTISEEEMEWYVAHAHYSDKAGGYAIQEHAALFVEGIQGCYYNVMGLPVQETLALFQLMGTSWQAFGS
ncbi:Maf family protein [Anoxynatronum buryatiense]|uniref:dTTP/UTP pyrophosphatase n=1 Tax=Anoxynatronum buryatiense TaxID=489973 RepID=A0AA45WTP4_9CLOT|nr:Maf family protein [Anoxynatronum buryatiense]SMP44148.1 septum formation protein [Anoxynatronum buryatiense]